MRKHGAPKHIISDRACVFTGDAFAELLQQWLDDAPFLSKRSLPHTRDKGSKSGSRMKRESASKEP